MPEAKLIALYPHPTDIEKFNRDYEAHVKLTHETLHLPEDVKPYSIIRFMETPAGKPAFYQMFMFTFPSVEAMQEALAGPAMQVLSADAVRLSTGGPPVFLFGA